MHKKQAERNQPSNTNDLRNLNGHHYTEEDMKEDIDRGEKECD